MDAEAYPEQWYWSCAAEEVNKLSVAHFEQDRLLRCSSTEETKLRDLA